MAIKKLRVTNTSGQAKKECIREVEIMSRLNSPNIVKFYGCAQQSSKFYIVMEFMVNGSLYDVLHSNYQLNWHQKENMMRDIAKGLMFLHKENILHRDLKSLNVLVDANYRLKLCDFGLSKIKNEIKSTKRSERVGTPSWMAPELFKRSAVYTEAADVYSMGITFWEIAARKIPFADAHDTSLIPTWVANGEREKIPSDCPQELKELISDCWDTDPSKRPTSEKVVEHLAEANVSLWEAASAGNLRAVQRLIAKGASVNEKNDYRDTPLLLAASKGHYEIVQCLLDNGASVNDKDDDGDTPLLLATFKGYFEIVRCLLAKGASVDEKNDDGDTALLAAASRGNYEIVQCLLAKGASVKKKDKNGNTALLLAASDGNFKIVRCLLDNGASVDEKNDDGDTALLLAASRRELKLIQCLLENGASVNIKNNKGDTALLYAISIGHFKAVQCLVTKGASVNEKDRNGGTALIYAAARGKLKLMQCLIENGASVNEQDENGDTALLVAASRGGSYEIVQGLLDKGASVNEVDKNGDTPLLLAASYGDLEVVQYLVAKGASVKHKNSKGLTAFDMALKHPEIRDFLKDFSQSSAGVSCSLFGKQNPRLGSTSPSSNASAYRRG